jgi:hypothetical protein
LVNQHQPSNFAARLGGLALANILSGEARYGYETLAPWVPWSWMMLDVYSPSHMIVSQVLTHTHITCQNLVIFFSIKQQDSHKFGASTTFGQTR